MRINELLTHTDNLDEASLGDIARAGVLGAGLIGAGLGANSLLNKAPDALQAISQPVQATQNAQTTDAVAQAKIQAEPQKTQDNPNFPAELKGLDAKDAKTRVSTFTRVVLPLIDAENAEIRKQRQALVQLSKQKSLTKAQASWIEGMKDYYKADSLRDLVAKVDIVPRSMALAQAAVESGWGQQPLAQQANVFYGQKTFDPNAPSAVGQYGEKYRAFDSPEDSVRAYMRNLNTHPAYEPFRLARAELRSKNRPLQGAQLVKSLGSYSTKGGYGQQLHSIIQGRGLNKLDTN
jgi:Bax protein